LKAFVDGRITESYRKSWRDDRKQFYFPAGSNRLRRRKHRQAESRILRIYRLLSRAQLMNENIIIAVKDNLTTSMLEWIKNKNIKGVIAASIDNKEWVNYHKKEIGVAITGDEDLGYSIVLIEGFGTSQLDDGFFDYLKRFQDQNISISGRTQIRAGIIRPQIILPVNIENN
jgi:hypothetical protein